MASNYKNEEKEFVEKFCRLSNSEPRLVLSKTYFDDLWPWIKEKLATERLNAIQEVIVAARELKVPKMKKFKVWGKFLRPDNPFLLRDFDEDFKTEIELPEDNDLGPTDFTMAVEKQLGYFVIDIHWEEIK
jgi:hypothetical protein